jgi:hypothetical protein
VAEKKRSPHDGLLLPRVARRINPNGSNRRWMKFQWHVNLIKRITLGKMMVSDDKKDRTNPTPKNEAPPKSKGTSGVDLSKGEGGEIATDLPAGYSRGERQKPVSKAYKDNWNAIFAKKKKR